MTDQEIVERYLETAYSVSPKGAQLLAFDKTTNTHVKDIVVFNNTAIIFGDFSTKITTKWLAIKKDEINNIVLNEITKLDLNLGSYINGHELARKTSRLGLTKEFTDTVFHPYYLRNKLNFNHKELFKEFRLVLGENHRGWNAYWGNEKIEPETLRNLFVNEETRKVTEILTDYDRWKIDAVIEQTERIMGIMNK